MHARHILCSSSVLCLYMLLNFKQPNLQPARLYQHWSETQVQEQNTRACLSRQRTTGLAYKISRNNTQWAKEKKGHL